MKIKRFFAADIREAIRQVRAEQGPDAVILSNTSVEGGVEIVAAVDYDEDLVHDLVPHFPPNKKSNAVSNNNNDENTVASDRGDSGAKHEAKVGAAPRRREMENVDGNAAYTPAPPLGDERIVWSQEPTLVAMRRQIDELREMLAHQLSGLAWGSAARGNPMRTQLLQMLLEAGFSPRLCMEIAEQVPQGCDFTTARRRALAVLAHRVKVWNEDITEHGGVIALVGPTGVGKTTTIAKLAARFSLRHGADNVHLITSDNYRVGAYEQLRTYARLLDMPLHVARDSAQIHAILDTVDARSLVLIDTAGMSQRAEKVKHQLALLSGATERLNIFLVMSAASEAAVLNEIAHVFGVLAPSACILTKLDEAATLGGMLSVLIQRQLPVAYVTDGQRVPEDLQVARSHRLIARSVVVRQYHERFSQHGAGKNAVAKEDKLTRHVAMANAFGRVYPGV